MSASPPTSPAPRPPSSAARPLVRALVLLGGVALFLFLAFNGVLLYVRTPAGTARLLRLGLEAANDAISGRLEAEGATIQGNHVVVRRAALFDAEGAEVASVERIDADIVFSTLLLGHIEARTLKLTHPSLSVALDEDGSNLDRTFAPRHPGPPEEGGKPAPLTFIVHHLDVEQGRLNLKTPEGPPFLLQGLVLGGAGRYALRSQDFELETQGNGALDQPTPGPVTISLRGLSRGRTFEADVDIRAAGASVVGDARRNNTTPLDGRVALDIPPNLARALLRDWPLRVPVALTAEARRSGSGFLVSGDAAAGAARLQLRADVDVERASARSFRVDAQHVHLLELFGHGPDTDVAFSLHGQGTGNSLATASGTLQLSVPPSRVRGAVVGPVELSARVQAGRFDVSALRVVLPGVELTGTGEGTSGSLEGTLQLEVQDFAALESTLGDVLGPVPPLAGHGTLRLKLSGRPTHPGLEAEGHFANLDVDAFHAQGLELAFHLADVARPTDANATLTANALLFSGRALKDVRAVLHSEGPSVELALDSGGLHLALAGTADGDARGMLLDSLSLNFSEETFRLKAPAAVRFDDKRLQTERLELVSGPQSLALTGGLAGSHVQLALEVVHLELGHLPALVAPPSLRLGGTLNLTASLRGAERHPDVAVQAELADGTWLGLKKVSAHLEGGRTAERLTLKGNVRALGANLDVALDAPELAMSQRIHQPLTLHLAVHGVDIADVLCVLAGAGVLAEGCPTGTAVVVGEAGLDADVSGFADGPAVHLTLSAHGLKGRGLSTDRVTLKLDGDEATPLGLALSGDVLGGALEAQASLKATTGQLLARRHSWTGWRTLPFEASVVSSGLQLVSLQEARLASRDWQGTLDVRAELSGTLGAPRGQATVLGHGLLLPPLPAGEAQLTLTATDSVEARLSLSGAGGETGQVHLAVGAPLSEILTGRSPEALSHAALSLQGDLGPFELRDLPLDATRLRRDRRLMDGQFHLAFEGRGTLLAPTLSATLKASNLGPADGAHFEGLAHLQSAQAKESFDVRLESQSGGTLALDGELALDVSLPALRRGLHLADAPLKAQLHSVRFEPDFVASLVPWMRSISGKLQLEAQAEGPLGHPSVKGSFAWSNGSLGIIGFGLYQNIQLKASASNDRFDIEELSAKVQGGALSLQLSGERAAKGFRLSGALSTTDMPIVFDDQLWCIATVKADLSGLGHLWELDLSKVNITQADLRLPEARRKNLQDLSALKDVILTRHGVPLDGENASLILSLDPRRRGQSIGQLVAKNIFLRLSLEAPNRVAVRSKDINLELALSKPFQVDVGDEPRIAGAVRIVRGRGDVWGRRFDVQTGGQVRFDGAPQNAILDVTGVYTSVQSQAKVYMHFSGEVTKVKITPSSDPPMSESEIYTLLATGRTELVQSSVGSSTAVAGASTGASVLGSWAANELKNAVGVALPIDVLSVEVGSDERGYNQTRLEAGKYLTDDIYIGYQARTNADPFRYQNANAIRVEYRFLRRWSLQLEYGDANAGSLDAVWSRDY